jgi:hypothetical protein
MMRDEVRADHSSISEFYIYRDNQNIIALVAGGPNIDDKFLFENKSVCI